MPWSAAQAAECIATREYLWIWSSGKSRYRNRIRPVFGVVGMVSDAKGEFEWKNHFVLMNDAYSGDCGYPSTVLLKDGQAMTLYYATLTKGEPKWSTHCGALTYRVP